MTAVLEVEGVGRRFGGVVALNDVSFSLGKGEILGVIGPNGAGKSTLLGALVGAPKSSRGAIRFAGHDITKWPVYKRSRAGIARTHQIPRPLASMTVEQNIHVAIRGDSSSTAVSAIADRVGLADRLQTSSGMLNHADMRRLEVARALAMRPSVLLLDEMGAGLTPTELEEFGKLIKGVAEDGVSVIVVEHIMDLVMSVAHRILVLDRGEAIKLGTPADVREDEDVIERYLGIS